MNRWAFVVGALLFGVSLGALCTGHFTEAMSEGVLAMAAFMLDQRTNER